MRVQFKIDPKANDQDCKVAPFAFFVEMPCRLNAGDFIVTWDFLGDRYKEFTEEQQDILFGLAWDVDSVGFDGDKEGIYQIVYCTGD